MSTQLIISNPWPEKKTSMANNKALEAMRTTVVGDELHKVAYKELREDENTRKQCLEHLREWIKQNEDIQNCITDDNFLLRFLRVKKFSIPMAQQTLLKYLNFRKRFSSYFYNLDYMEKNVHDLIMEGFIIVSPYRDSNGRRVVVYDLSKFDMNKYTNVDMAKAVAVTYETLINEEETQIMGVNHIADVAGANASFLSLFSITEFATLINWGEQSFPIRHRDINLINLPQALKVVYDFARSRMSDKLKDRFRIHNSKADLFKSVDRYCLPKEMGGELPAKEMIDLWKAKLEEKKDRLLALDNIVLLSDRGIITRRNQPAKDNMGIGCLAGSFRKLEVD